MTLVTAFTEMFSLRFLIASAPMGGSAGGGLAVAVSEGGGLGLVGAGSGEGPWLDKELSVIRDERPARWGVGFLTWAVTMAAIDKALAAHPPALMLSFGDPSEYVGAVHRSDTALILQVTDLEEARQAVDLGADVIVAQGTEGGGHGAHRGRSTLPFVPMVVDLAGSTPVLAAGGIADGRGVAAALALGAAGALIGTRFQTTTESLAPDVVKTAILAGRGDQTERSRVLDIARGSAWPDRYPARSLGHPYLDRWRGRETELAADEVAKQEYQEQIAQGTLPPVPVWAGEAADLINDVVSATALVRRIGEQAEVALHRAAN